MQRSFSFRIIVSVALLFVVLGLPLFARPSGEVSPGAVPIKGKITLSTTTSTQDSGLLDVLLPVFTRETGWEVDVISVGTGAALRMGRDGDADVLLVHARAEEERFVAEGYGIRRFDVMYNDFLVVGPNLTTIPHNADVRQTFRNIASGNLRFVSRGDNSGTHTMENNLWAAIGVAPASFSNYVSAGQGMGATLQMAYEMRAYTLTDRATWLTLSRDNRISLPAVCEQDQQLLNYYGVIAVNPARHPGINAEGGQAFVDWMLRASTQALIGQYGIAEFGGALFTPNAQ